MRGTGQHLFINNRAVVSPLISYAIREGYGTTLPTNRHPIFVLNLAMPGPLVDVNVHPQKREVRLCQSYQLREVVIKAVEEALYGTVEKSSVSLPEISTMAFEPPPEPVAKIETPAPPPTVEHKQVSFFEKEEKKPVAPRVLASLPGYLLLNSEAGGVKWVDQRAAHARIIYEQLQERKEIGLAVQNLLIPYTLEVSTLDAAVLMENLEYFHKIGVQIEEFGERTFVVHAVPQVWSEANLQQLITDIVHDLREFCGESVSSGDRDKRMALAAGRAAVSQKATLSPPEGQSLMNQLYRCATPFLCPYGKPTISEMTQEDLAKQFQKS